MLVDGFCFGCRTLRGERSGDESVGHQLEPWRALSRCGSGASTRRPAYIGIKGQGKKIADRLGVKHIAVSITHTAEQAFAQLIFES